jgi:hypothetical protein
MKLRITVLYILLGFFALGSFNCAFKRYEKREVSEYRVNLDGKTKVTLENVNGKIDVYKGDSASGLVIKAEKIAKVKKRELNEPFTEASVDVDTSSEVVRIKSMMEKHKGFIRFDINGGTKINYTITLPPGVDFSVDNTNGNAGFTNISNNLNVEIINGSVNLDNASGSNKFDLTNGKVKGKLDSTKGMIIDIVNGRVDLELDSTFSAKFKIETVNGRISEENLNFNSIASNKKSLVGSLGDSDAEVKMDVVNGKVILKGK